MVRKGAPLPYLSEWRIWRGMTQEELGEKAGVTPTTISRIEHGTLARFGTIARLAQALKIEREQLMREKPSNSQAA